jgi:PKHD-type hydroxylase
MLVQIPALLTKDDVAALRADIDAAEWIDGNETSGHQSSGVKNNLQLPEASDAAKAAGDRLRAALEANPVFIAAALPAGLYPPLFNRYGEGHGFGDHVDNAIRRRKGTDFRIRTDLSATVFLTEPADYDGGELVIEDTFGVHEIKLGAGDMILYPSSSLHRVTPVTRGARVCSIFWVQSLVRDDAQRTLLFDMDLAIRGLTQRVGGQDPAVVSLTGAYHNLLRMWAEV